VVEAVVTDLDGTRLLNSATVRLALPNKHLERTVRDKVPRHIRQRAAAELRR
jgi:hypothetical protein